MQADKHMNTILGHFREIAIAGFLAVVLTTSYGIYTQSVKDSEPITNWFTLNQVNVPDFYVGEDPVIAYDRLIFKDFSADITVELHAVDSESTRLICVGHKKQKYTVKTGFDVTGITLSWFMNTRCDQIKVGNYRLIAYWKIHRPGYKDITVKTLSNIFRVLSPREDLIKELLEQQGKMTIVPQKDDKLPENTESIPHELASE